MRFLILYSLVLMPISALAHELWIEPIDYQIEEETKAQARLVNGEGFKGVELAFFPNRIKEFNVYNGAEVIAVDTRLGNKPAFDAPSLPDGLNILVYQSKPSELTYKEPEKFERFLKHKDLGVTINDHLARGLSADNITEVYTRFSKSLIAVGDGAGADRLIGLETELVALTNPYDLVGPMQVQLFYQDSPRANEQIEVFERAEDDSVTISTFRTDADGIATIPVKPNHEYMLDAVVLRIPTDEVAEEYSAMWETLWANLTFFVPE